jgi:hypothetical protein
MPLPIQRIQMDRGIEFFAKMSHGGKWNGPSG